MNMMGTDMIDRLGETNSGSYPGVRGARVRGSRVRGARVRGSAVRGQH